MFVYKIHRQDGHVILAICDEELLGKTLKGEIDFKISENFYGSEHCKEKELLGFIKSATMVNAVGNRVVEVLVKNSFVEKENVITIKNVKHCQIYSL